MFGRVLGTRPNISESHSETSTQYPFVLTQAVWSAVHYSTNFYSRVAVQKVQQHDAANASAPLFIDLRYQGVHGPYEEPPLWEQQPNSSGAKCGPTTTCQTLRSMVAVVGPRGLHFPRAPCLPLTLPVQLGRSRGVAQTKRVHTPCR